MFQAQAQDRLRHHPVDEINQESSGLSLLLLHSLGNFLPNEFTFHSAFVFLEFCRSFTLYSPPLF